ncbi:hypothetical protein EVB94_213 [Rhizobium phage RHph_TM40]|uniref:Uncharacterized protein n=2 Tax=Cuauhnahuacvirus TaxID=3044696 RepID=A0A7S5R856_9CAUD|nr:hypothetical protein PQC16_gp214 [Rhizobium phage RHph_TM30]YP_010671363.1 hypothetical protein PQC17_gp214 [Rhizobium phage RHph_Y65]QIG71684.1 hypothetical protein EVB94_213 [Rhizobium phage RHph_TM40]QIG72047.1 hypothetical protein EVB95_213 [Rhizobium phage RHph_TM2_3B]QIG72410.1 hypothetical protein EVB96_214 [Rhizobium phage RHph_TM3_3_6]QIG77800.1 hypothetical protein EVB64_213 [Rhizobium phage RHph_TM61]QIG71321.1 hypothetical protein EVB93_214 [Rhizobium phage RHph_TM30]
MTTASSLEDIVYSINKVLSSPIESSVAPRITSTLSSLLKLQESHMKTLKDIKSKMESSES